MGPGQTSAPCTIKGWYTAANQLMTSSGLGTTLENKGSGAFSRLERVKFSQNKFK
jgi:hypothetical protein